MQGKNIELDQEICTLRLKNEHLQEQVFIHETEFAKLENATKREQTYLKSEINDKDEQIQMMLEPLDSAINDHSQLNTDMFVGMNSNGRINYMSNLVKKCITIGKENDILMSKLTEEQKKNSDMTIQLDAKDKEVKRLLNSVQNATESIEKLERELLDLRSLNSELRHEIRSITTEAMRNQGLMSQCLGIKQEQMGGMKDFIDLLKTKYVIEDKALTNHFIQKQNTVVQKDKTLHMSFNSPTQKDKKFTVYRTISNSN